MDPSALNDISVAMREMADWTGVFDRIHSAAIKTAEEARRESVLTEAHEEALLTNVSARLCKNKSSLVGISTALESTRERAMQAGGGGGGNEALIDFFQRTSEEILGRATESDIDKDPHHKKLRSILGQETGGESMESNDDGETSLLAVLETQLSRKCPITQQPMVNPCKNRTCGHAYEREAVMRYIRDKRRNGTATVCPQMGCGNKNIAEKDLEAFVMMD